MASLTEAIVCDPCVDQSNSHVFDVFVLISGQGQHADRNLAPCAIENFQKTLNGRLNCSPRH